MRSIHDLKKNHDGYRLGGSNPVYEARSMRIQSTKSMVPSVLPSVKFRAGWIDDYVEHQEMLEYYQQRQLYLITRRDMAGLQRLESMFCRSYPARPQLEDYNSEEEYVTGANQWIQGERSRLLDGFSPYCLPEAKRIIGKIAINEQWSNRHSAIVNEYEKTIVEYTDRSNRIVNWECNNSRFSIG